MSKDIRLYERFWLNDDWGVTGTVSTHKETTSIGTSKIDSQGEELSKLTKDVSSIKSKI